MWVVLGFRGAGKSSFCKRLQDQYALKVFATDAYIANQHQQDLDSLIQQKGWAYFREEEKKALILGLQGDYHLIDTGGGIVELEENRLLLSQCLCLHLVRGWSSLYRYLQKDTSRPPLASDKASLESIFLRRQNYYQALSQESLSFTDDPF